MDIIEKVNVKVEILTKFFHKGLNKESVLYTAKWDKNLTWLDHYEGCLERKVSCLKNAIVYKISNEDTDTYGIALPEEFERMKEIFEMRHSPLTTLN